MPKRTQYVPKHKHVAERSFAQAPKKALRNTVVMSSVAVATTGIAVSGGVLHATTGVGGPSAAGDLGTAVLGQSSDQVSSDVAGQPSGARAASAPTVDRAPVVSRSSDRRDEADPAKEAALSVDAGPALTQRVELSQADPKSIAQTLMPQFGFSSDQFDCLDLLWTRESGWNVSADNPSSSAYGIPQALPGEKMATAGADWATNPATQIEWGLGYIRDSYGSPCGAWAHSEATGWY